MNEAHVTQVLCAQLHYTIIIHESEHCVDNLYFMHLLIAHSVAITLSGRAGECQA